MATVAQFLLSELSALGRTPNDVQIVSRYVPEIGAWLQIGRAEFIAAAQQVQHPIGGGTWYKFESYKSDEDDRVLLYNGIVARVLDPDAVYAFTAQQLDGTDPFP